MSDFKKHYMSVMADVLDNGISLSIWMSPEDLFRNERQQFPFIYTYMADNCTWMMHSNIELTPKLIAMCGEQADRICIEQARINDRRKLSNR